jgi:hypothetical protein
MMTRASPGSAATTDGNNASWSRSKVRRRSIMTELRSVKLTSQAALTDASK